VLAISQFELGNLRARQGDLTTARASFRSVIALSQASGDVQTEVLGHNNAAYHALLDGDLPDAHAHLDAGLQLMEATDLPIARQWLFSTAGELALAESRWDDAETWLHRALVAAEEQANPEQVASTRANLALVARGRGRLHEAAVLLEAADHLASGLQSPSLQAEIALRQAEVALEQGDHTVAAAALDRAEQLLEGEPNPRLGDRLVAARETLKTSKRQ
jgi:ATP/maltotriose-dependent transcriptional regulator MalT